ncbi:MAG: hypothetical protein KDA61_05580, partial [Planctomycetales bacterium]|nr:hypothetical protein [Planctomycetales bacterium]
MSEANGDASQGTLAQSPAGRVQSVAIIRRDAEAGSLRGPPRCVAPMHRTICTATPNLLAVVRLRVSYLS